MQSSLKPRSQQSIPRLGGRKRGGLWPTMLLPILSFAVTGALASTVMAAQTPVMLSPSTGLDTGLTTATQSAQDYLNNGNAHLMQGAYSEAMTDYNQALKMNPDLAEAYTNRGIARTFQQDFSGAIADYNQALRLEPGNAATYTNRGIARTFQQDYAAAIADYNQALRLNPENATAYYNRGVTLVLSGDNQKAVADLEKASALYQQQGSISDYRDAQSLLNRIQTVQ